MKNQNSSYELFCLKVNGSWSNWSLWRLTPRHRHHLDTTRLANYLAKEPNKPNLRQHKKNQHTQKTQSKNQATLVDPARKRSGLLHTGPGTTRARLPASRFARFLSSARGRRRSIRKYFSLKDNEKNNKNPIQISHNKSNTNITATVAQCDNTCYFSPDHQQISGLLPAFQVTGNSVKHYALHSKITLHANYAFYSRQNSETFDVLHAFLSLVVAKLWSQKHSGFFGPPCRSL